MSSVGKASKVRFDILSDINNRQDAESSDGPAFALPKWRSLLPGVE